MIYATDIDESELRIARNGTFLLDQLSGLPDNLRDQYFLRQGDLYTINDDIRSIITFGRHNILIDPPITNIDLLLCRYVLLYLDPSLIPKALQNLRYALNNGGLLWLGKGERHIDSNKYGFKPFGNKWCFFKKQPIQKHYQISAINFNIKNFLSQKAITDNNIYQENYNIETGIIALNEDLDIIFYNQIAFDICFNKNLEIQNIDDSQSFADICQNSSTVKKDKKISFLDLNINCYIEKIQDKIKELTNKRDYLIIDGVEHWQEKNSKIYLRIIIIPLSIINIENKDILVILDNMTKFYEFGEKTRFMLKSFETAKEKLLSENSILEKATDELEIINKYLQSRNNEEFILLNEKIIKQSMEFEILKNQYEAILDSIGLGVMIVDQNFIVKNINSLAIKYLEINYEFIIDKSLIGINNNKILSDVLKRISETMEIREPMNFIIDSSNSEKQFLDIKINPINKKKNEGVILIIKEGVLSSC
jgi:two-component system CheB/CheR fusion protein